MVDVLDAELCRIIRVRVPSLRKECGLVMCCGLMKFVGLHSCANRQLIIAGVA